MNRLFSLCLVALASNALASSWDFDPAHSQASFTVKHMMVTNVHGEFQKMTGHADLDDKDIARSKVEAKLETASISTNDAKRDAHLKSAEFFDAAKCPDVTFKSKKVEKAGENKLKVNGELTMHCITKDVSLDVTGPTPAMKGPWGNSVRAVSATTTINRKDFALNWNKTLEAGGVLVGDEVQINLEIELVPAQPVGAKTATVKGSEKK